MTLLIHYLLIALSAIAVYLFIIFAIRIFGKTEIAQLSVMDLVFIMLLSNAVQNAMVGPDTSLPGGLVAACALFLTDAVFKEFMFRFPKFGKLMQGDPLMLIYKGHVNDANMKKARLTTDELLEAIREHGSEKISDVDLAVLEVDGNISVLSSDFKEQTTRSVRKTRRTESHAD